MGTRNLTFVILDKKIRVAQYCQWDGYPCGQGKDIANFLTKAMNKKLFREKIRALKSVSAKKVESYWKKLGADGSGSVSFKVSDKLKDKYPQFHRDTGAKILQLIQDGKTKEVYLNTEFMKDSLFCEYAYVIDLDSGVLEVYEGFNQKPMRKDERFYSSEANKEGFFPVRLKRKFKFFELKEPSAKRFFRRS